MKKVKIAFWVVIIILLGILIYQNQPYFFTKHSLQINLWVTEGITKDLYNIIFIAAFFAGGLLIAYISTLFERFKLNKIIKELRNKEKTNQATIAEMRKEVDALKKPTEPELPPQATDDAQIEPTDTENAQPSKS